ncbi:MAG: DNRLRE domain-containing protein [Chloroflexi bacterium]|nr:DNRLRE domain-containing protein [Chloroflexota bacterium]
MTKRDAHFVALAASLTLTVFAASVPTNPEHLFAADANRQAPRPATTTFTPTAWAYLPAVMGMPPPLASRRVNIPYFASGPSWYRSAIFWFGQNKQGLPSRNYADVRMSYSNIGLHVQVTVIDYYLWYWDPNDSSLTGSLTDYDAVALYLGTDSNKPNTPQTNHYMFLSGTRPGPNENAPTYHQQARGTGSGWDTNWNGTWTDYSAMQWSCNPGPNSNTCGIDFGWFSMFTIPWGSIGLSGPPPAETVWNLGILLYDRDANPPAGYVAPDYWPETFNPNNPSTWGELHFGYANHIAPPAQVQGTTLVRAASDTDNSSVVDAWMGGGGTCSSGHEGGTETNHGDDANLFVGTETAPTHFPCFNKSYLRFSLDTIPAGKVIVSATLTLHLWGGADPSQAQPSWVHLFSIRDPWDEMSIQWNNAPLAWENVSAQWLYTYSKPAIDWPGDPYTWDATKAVAEAYADGRPVSLAIYGSDTEQHSSKYLTSSEVGNWDVEGRPTLRVVWGSP